MPICLRLLAHLMRAAASRTFWTAGRSRPMRMAMIAITTSSSISVKPPRLFGLTILELLGLTGLEMKDRSATQPGGDLDAQPGLRVVASGHGLLVGDDF